MLGAAKQRTGLLRIERADHLRRRSDDQGIVGERLAFGDDRAGADHAALADPRAVHDDGAHADQRAVLDGAAVQDDVVANGAALADGQRKPGVGMKRAVVLHVGALADVDQFVVAAQHRTEPHAGIQTQPHIADHLGAVSNEIVSVRTLRGPPVQFIDRHTAPSFERSVPDPARTGGQIAMDRDWMARPGGRVVTRKSR